jgi:4-hydroxy-tetrahydrodipicolinate reductase
MKEIHHIEKIDAPSGTAITLAESIIKETDYQKWSLNKDFKENEISIEAQRLSDKTGTHEVIYKSDIDEIKIKHAAVNREGFGLGAVIAAEWLIGKKGVFSMKDVLNINGLKIFLYEFTRMVLLWISNSINSWNRNMEAI